jgi:hypothetical protein
MDMYWIPFDEYNNYNFNAIMKTLMLALAIGGGMCFAIAQTQAEVAIAEAVEFTFQEKTKIDPENLPEKVKEAIQNDAAIRSSQITEAHQVMEDNQVFYVVKFDRDAEGNEKITKKFDVTGNEIEDASGQR